jgi:hypothetical protein
MPFEGKARVQALATLFDYGTEDENGRTYSQKRLAEGLGAYCIGVITRVYAARGNKVARYLVKWDEGTSTSIEKQHLTLVGTSEESSTSNADEESAGLSDHMTRDAESTDDERDEEEGDELPPGHDADAVITPIGGQVQCGEYRWRRVKAISTDTRAAFPEFDFSLRQTTIT